MKFSIARLHRRLPPSALKYFTRRGNGVMVRCNFCGELPPEDLEYTYERLWWLNGHFASKHHGKEKVIFPAKIGASHAAEQSLEAKRRPPREAERNHYAVQ